MSSKLAVIAFGGNALQLAGGKGTAEEQLQACYETCKNLIPLIKKGYNIVLTHGNGPQVGVKILKEMAGETVYKLPKYPMHISVAETQGSIAYCIESMTSRVLKENNIDKNVVSIVTQVEVSFKDEAFQNPRKPVGIYYTEEEMKKQQEENKDFVYKEDAKKAGMYRRVVPSPRPIEIKNRSIIETLARQGNIVITCGGGGIPYAKTEEGLEIGVDAVIDKDLASSVLAQKIKADEFLIFTDVSNAYINFRKPDERKLTDVKVEEMKKYAEEGHFGAGSMGPKVKAVNEFVENSGNGIAIITDAKTLSSGGKGTVITK